MRSDLRERLAQLGPIRTVHPESGPSADLVLRPRLDLAKTNVISATMSLVQRGMTMLRAKRAVEAAIRDGTATVEVPGVENLIQLALELHEAGLHATVIATEQTQALDVKVIRERLGMTQAQFSYRYGFELDTLQNWEQGRTAVTGHAYHYLRAIAADPRGTAEAQEEEILEQKRA